MPIIDTALVDESRDRYLTYALSVVSSRALPDVRDGLKPVQRRILFDMYRNLRLLPSGSHRKSAAVVGGVLARFHPHGDIACYEAMVRMAQDFSLRYPLVDGQGNFGSIDGDNAAAYRYTEVRLTALAIEVIGELDHETVGFRDNFDATQEEPTVLPSRVPNLLINGAVGIAVGLATSIPPHNLKDVVSALIELADDAEISPTKLAGTVKAPDFPTGCAILNTRAELNEMYRTGKGSVRMRGEWTTEEGNRGKKFIIITSVPYAVQKSQLVEKFADAILSKSLPQLVDVRDESTEKVRIVLELASGADPEIAMAYLFKHTPIESSFHVNLTCLVPSGKDGKLRPETVPLKEMLQYFLAFRFEVTEKRLRFEKRKLEERIHILEGLVLIFDALDEAIRIVRKSEGRSDAAEKLRKRFKLSEIQAFAVVDMRIYQLSRTSIDEIRAELAEKEKRIEEIDTILKSKAKMKKLVVDDLQRVANEYGDKRKSSIMRENIAIEFNEADYVVQEEVFAIVTKDGWIKRIRQTNELGSTRMREGDAILQAHAVSTLNTILIFTNLGYLYALKVNDFPSSSGYGDPIQKILKFRDGEAVAESFPLGTKVEKGKQAELFGGSGSGLAVGEKILFLSRRGLGYLSTLEEVEGLKRTGKRVAKVRAGDGLITICKPSKEIAMFTSKGSGLRIASKEIPERSGASVGVILMSVRDDDEICAVVPLIPGDQVILLLDSGGEKKIPAADITIGRRALKGTKVIARGGLLGAKLFKK